jgi:hypothetical protein
LIAQEQLPLKNHVPWGVKGITCFERKGLSYPKGATMFPWGIKRLKLLWGTTMFLGGARGLSCPMDMVVP